MDILKISILRRNQRAYANSTYEYAIVLLVSMVCESGLRRPCMQKTYVVRNEAGIITK